MATAIAIYTARHRDTHPRDVDAIVEAAKETVRKLDDALELLRKNSEPASAQQ
ncbi:MAG: hypothetical protein ACPL7K_03885 [Armatimonadota bacterium]